MKTHAASEALSPSLLPTSSTSSEGPGARRGAPAAARLAVLGAGLALCFVTGCRRDPAPQTAYNNGYNGAYGTAPPGGGYPPGGTDPSWTAANPGTPPPGVGAYPSTPSAPPAAPQAGTPGGTTAPAAGGFQIPGFPFPMPGAGGGGETTGGGGTAAPPGPGLPTGGGSLLQPPLLPLANQHAPGARPEGQPVSGFLSQGQPSTTAVQIAPGRCYTAVAVASPPIGDLMIELVATPPAPFPPVTLAQAAGGTQVVMAGQPNCFRPMSPVAVAGVLRVTARQGSGPVLAQLYAKLGRPPTPTASATAAACAGRSASAIAGRSASPIAGREILTTSVRVSRAGDFALRGGASERRSAESGDHSTLVRRRRRLRVRTQRVRKNARRVPRHEENPRAALIATFGYLARACVFIGGRRPFRPARARRGRGGGENEP